MSEVSKTVAYDPELRVEAYRFQGMAQPFANHFHEYYVIGLMEQGERRLSCRGREYTLHAGDMVLFHPGDNHACTQSDGGRLTYRGLSIPETVMLEVAEGVTGRRLLPGFCENVISDEEAACCMRTLHEAILRRQGGPEKEEGLWLLISLLLERYGQPFESTVPECREEIEEACWFMRQHYAQRLTLTEICRWAGLSKSTLLRAFTRAKGVTPYSYLENVRIGEAKKLLERGMPPAEAALRTGFSDQSHFTNCFRRFIGVTPGAYGAVFRQRRNGERTYR